MNTGVQIAHQEPDFVSFGYTYPGGGWVDHIIIPLLAFWGTSILLSLVTATSYLPISSAHPHPHRRLLPLVFLVTAIPTGVKFCPIVVEFTVPLWLVMLVSLLVPVGHLYVYFRKEYLFSSSDYFLIRFCCYSYEFFMYFDMSPFIRYLICKYCLTFYRFTFLFGWLFPLCYRIIIFYITPLTNFCFCCLGFLCHMPKHDWQDQC